MSRIEIETVSLADGAGDRSLWRAVITQAINDATLYCDPNATGASAVYRMMTKRDAVEWLTKPNANFNQVCALADLEPTQVRRLAMAWMANPELATKREARSRTTSAKTKAAKRRRPGVVENFAETSRDRPGSVAQESA